MTLFVAAIGQQRNAALTKETTTACRSDDPTGANSTARAARSPARPDQHDEPLSPRARWRKAAPPASNPSAPISRGRFVEHAAARAAVLPTNQLFRHRTGRPTSRRHDDLSRRLGQQLPWAAAQGVSTHWLLHTALTWVERHFGYGITRAYAGHTDSTGPATYIKPPSTKPPPPSPP